MCHSFIRGWEEWGKLGHCPGQMRQSSVFCIWYFMSVPEIEPLNQTPLCRWGHHCALYNFTVGIALCSYSDINLSQFCWQGFTYFTNSNWMYLTFVLILYPKHKASPEGKFYPPFSRDSKNSIFKFRTKSWCYYYSRLTSWCPLAVCCNFGITNPVMP